MNDVDDLFFKAIENSARRNNQLAIRQAPEFGWSRTHERKLLKALNGSKDLLDQFMSSLGFVQRNIISNRIQFLNRRFRPGYSSHRFNRCLAWMWVAVRPSWMALSPRAIPSRIRSRF